MGIEVCVEGMKKGELEAFESAEDFLNKFNVGKEFSHLKNTSIENCVRYFYRFYAEKNMQKNLRLACQHLEAKQQTEANSYLKLAGIYLQKLSSNSS